MYILNVLLCLSQPLVIYSVIENRNKTLLVTHFYGLVKEPNKAPKQAKAEQKSFTPSDQTASANTLLGPGGGQHTGDTKEKTHNY